MIFDYSSSKKSDKSEYEYILRGTQGIILGLEAYRKKKLKYINKILKPNIVLLTKKIKTESDTLLEYKEKLINLVEREDNFYKNENREDHLDYGLENHNSILSLKDSDLYKSFGSHF